MAITTKRNFGPITRDARFTRTDWNIIGIAITDRIQGRTAAGVDGQNRPFAPYAPSYAKLREREGFRKSPVNLQVSGQMMTGMVVLPTDTSVTVTFKD